MATPFSSTSTCSRYGFRRVGRNRCVITSGGEGHRFQQTEPLRIRLRPAIARTRRPQHPACVGCRSGRRNPGGTSPRDRTHGLVSADDRSVAIAPGALGCGVPKSCARSRDLVSGAAKAVVVVHRRNRIRFACRRRSRRRSGHHRDVRSRRPVACSGLPVRRYGTDSLSRALGGRFEPVSFEYETHVTPTDATQQFLYGRFRRRDDRPDRPATSARLSHNCLAPDQREYTLIRGLRYLAHRRTRRPGNYALAAWMILVISSTVGTRPVILTSPLIASAGIDMTP